MTKTNHTTPTVRHTPGPWFYNRDEGGLYEHNVNVEEGEICQVFDPAGNHEGVKAANARRIVAAVNACEGIATSALEQGVVRELLTEAMRLLSNAQYDDGLAIVSTQDWEALEAAIAKAKGQQP